MNAIVNTDLIVPALGAEWKEQGGIYAGLVRGRDGKPDYHLIVAPPALETANWKKTNEWAAGIDHEGHHDYALPTRLEQRFLFVQVPELFEPEDAYWSGSAEDARHAWCQYFSNGSQLYTSQSSELRARAVRRVPAQ